MGYLKDSLKGIGWMGALRVITRGFSFVKIAILARILLPQQFGIYGIAALELAFLEKITETGINVYLIQLKKDVEKYINSAWVISIIRGLILSAAIYISAPLVSGFFNSAESETMLRLITLVPFVRAFINPSIVKLEKDLEFNKEFFIRLSILLVDSVVSAVLALVSKNPTALVWGLTAGAIVELMISHIFIKPRPKFIFELNKLKNVINRGKWVTASGIFDYFFREGDDIVVGKILNTQELGLYQVAYKISILPITEVASVVNKVTFPVFTKISGDFNRLKKAFVKTIIAVTLLTLPIGILLYFFPKQIILLILGENWVGAVDVLRILSLFGVLSALIGPSSSLFLALNKQEYTAAFTLVSILGLAITIVPLVRLYGIVGAGISAMIGLLISLPFVLYFTIKLLRR